MKPIIWRLVALAAFALVYLPALKTLWIAIQQF